MTEGTKVARIQIGNRINKKVMNPNRYDWYEFMISLSRKPMEPSTRNLVMRQTRRITPQQVESIKTGAPRPQRERSNSRPGVRHVYPSYTKGQTVVQTKGRSIPLVPIELKLSLIHI